MTTCPGRRKAFGARSCRHGVDTTSANVHTGHMTTTRTAPALWTPRPYQCDSITAIYADWRNGILRPAIILPTGSGKTTVFAELIVKHFRDGGHKVLVIAHRVELISQAVDRVSQAFDMYGMDRRVGIVMGSESDESDADVVVASVATLTRTRRRLDAILPVDLVIYDEVHHSVAPSTLEMLKRTGVFATVRFAGFTATLERGDQVGLGGLIQHVAYQRDIAFMITHGWLVGHDEREFDGTTPDEIADAWQREARMRQGGIFTTRVAKAHAITASLTRKGIRAIAIDGTMSTANRDAAYLATRQRRNQVLVSVGVLTEGFDMAQLEVGMIDRDVKSHGLYVQIVGRFIRPYPGKSRALILIGRGKAKNARRIGLRSVADLGRGDEVKEAQNATQSATTASTATPVGGSGGSPANEPGERHFTIRVRNAWLGNGYVARVYENGRKRATFRANTVAKVKARAHSYVAGL